MMRRSQALGNPTSPSGQGGVVLAQLPKATHSPELCLLPPPRALFHLRLKSSSKIYVAPGRLGCQVPGKTGLGGGSSPPPTAGAGHVPGAGAPAGAGAGTPACRCPSLPREAGETWMRLVLRNLDSCPWTATKTLPSRWRWSTEHVAVVRMPQVSNLVFPVFSAKLASVTL